MIGRLTRAESEHPWPVLESGQNPYVIRQMCARMRIVLDSLSSDLLNVECVSPVSTMRIDFKKSPSPINNLDVGRLAHQMHLERLRRSKQIFVETAVVAIV
jgi:hypothetical protein